MKRRDFDGLVPRSPDWWENKSVGLVSTSSSSELRHACYFPEHLSGRSLLAAELIVRDQQGYWIGSCVVHPAFAHLFSGIPSHFHFDHGVYFDDIAGHEWERKVSITPKEWIRTNILALEDLHRKTVQSQAELRDDVLPARDLFSGIIERLVKDYKFKADDFPDPAAATEEFCRRFAYKADFEKLLHPRASVQRFFEAKRAQ